MPPVLASIPCAYLGGTISIEKYYFLLLLFIVLLAAGLRLAFNFRKYNEDPKKYSPFSPLLGATFGSVIGFISGLVGIGGGIFLAPILFNLRAAPPKQIAATASLFILANSLSGLAGQLQKNGLSDALIEYWHLPLLVLFGGQIGNLLTLRVIPARYVALLTALLVLFVAMRLGYHIFI